MFLFFLENVRARIDGYGPHPAGGVYMHRCAGSTTGFLQKYDEWTFGGS